MNMIDKDAVLHMIDINTEPHAHGEWDSGYNVALSEMREKIKQIPTIEAELDNGWISVKDKMPRLGQRVMASCRAGIMTFLRYDGEVWFEMSSRNEYLLSFVTHWQPLPEPPKGE